MPTGKWVCVEWVVRNPATGLESEPAIEVRVDGRREISWNGALPFGFDTLQVGLFSTRAGPAREVFYDDVAVATGDTPIGCPP
jgi:hypothetical protein